MSEFIQPISSSQPDPAISADNQDILSSLSQSIPENDPIKEFQDKQAASANDARNFAETLEQKRSDNYHEKGPGTSNHSSEILKRAAGYHKLYVT